MKIKAKPGDFRVRELLDERYLRPKGRFQVYKVTKRKLTSFEAASALAVEAGVASNDVGLAGLKDRQGVTTQFMSVPGGRTVRLKTDELSIEPVGFATTPLASAHSAGNAFEITLRGLERREVARLEREVGDVREHGLVNYFGEQRFGNLKHNQGWIARDLALGNTERALEALVATPNEHDDVKNKRFKTALAERWGDWRACREIAGKFGGHHSIFEHLARNPGDFAGAFEFVASRIRLIHLYAWQSHLWNRAVARCVEDATPAERRISVPAPEGRLFFARGALALDPTMQNRFRLPGPRLEDVAHARQKELLTEVLARERLAPADYAIEGVPGFQLKGEDREIVIRPRELRLSEPELDRRGAGARIRVRFDLPRGAYATLVIDRLVADDRIVPADRDVRPVRESARDRRRVRRAAKAQPVAEEGAAVKGRVDSPRIAPKKKRAPDAAPAIADTTDGDAQARRATASNERRIGSARSRGPDAKPARTRPGPAPRGGNGERTRMSAPPSPGDRARSGDRPRAGNRSPAGDRGESARAGDRARTRDGAQPGDRARTPRTHGGAHTGDRTRSGERGRTGAPGAHGGRGARGPAGESARTAPVHHAPSFSDHDKGKGRGGSGAARARKDRGSAGGGAPRRSSGDAPRGKDR